MAPGRALGSRYLVEWYGADLTDEVLRQTARTIDRSVGEVAAEGTAVDLLLAMFVPADEVAFCLFAADSPTSVARVCRRARLPVHRITEALTHQPPAGKAESR